MTFATSAFSAALRRIAARAGREAAQRLAAVRDELLIEAGKAAERRQHDRVARQRVRRAGRRVVAVAAAAVAAVAAGLALRRRPRRPRRSKPTKA